MPPSGVRCLRRLGAAVRMLLNPFTITLSPKRIDRRSRDAAVSCLPFEFRGGQGRWRRAKRAASYLRNLPETWRKAEGGRGRRLLAAALFDRIDVLGLAEATVNLSAEATRHGLGRVLPERLALSVNGRGERI